MARCQSCFWTKSRSATPRLGWIFPAFYRLRHNIKEQRLQQDRTNVATALDRIARELQPSGYLVGEVFSVADLAAAAMLGALLQPPELQYPLAVTLPDSLRQYRDDLARHRAAQWALEMYRRHRGSRPKSGAKNGWTSKRGPNHRPHWFQGLPRACVVEKNLAV
jgi:glutathione S-transferase